MKEVVLEAGGLLRGSSAPALQTFLSRQSGIHHVEANTFSDTVTVGYDEDTISDTRIRQLIEECGYHCRGEVYPRHMVVNESDELVTRTLHGDAVAPAERRHDLHGTAHAGHMMPDAPPLPAKSSKWRTRWVMALG